MFHVVLYQPEIPPNTGNIIRLCANTGINLHLIHPLGFSLDERRLRRAGLDYHEFVQITEHDCLPDFLDRVAPPRLFAFSTHATRSYADAIFQRGDALMFGPETRGLPVNIRQSLPESRCLRIPMLAGNRSLNLSNAVAVVCYEAWRQHDFLVT